MWDDTLERGLKCTGSERHGYNNINNGHVFPRKKSDTSAKSVASKSPSAKRKGSPRTTTTSRAKGRRKDQNLNESKETIDPSLRTKEETLHLIKLRDEMISAKHREVGGWVDAIVHMKTYEHNDKSNHLVLAALTS